jgi:hypothetical protein
MDNKKIGQYLIKGGNIEQWQLDIALKHQEAEGGLLGEILVKKGFLKDQVLIDALTEQANDRES